MNKQISVDFFLFLEQILFTAAECAIKTFCYKGPLFPYQHLFNEYMCKSVEYSGFVQTGFKLSALISFTEMQKINNASHPSGVWITTFQLRPKKPFSFISAVMNY